MGLYSLLYFPLCNQGGFFLLSSIILWYIYVLEPDEKGAR